MIASITCWGVWVPPGASKRAVPAFRAGKQARIACTSRVSPVRALSLLKGCSRGEGAGGADGAGRRADPPGPRTGRAGPPIPPQGRTRSPPPGASAALAPPGASAVLALPAHTRTAHGPAHANGGRRVRRPPSRTGRAAGSRSRTTVRRDRPGYPAYVSNSATFGVPVEPVISKVTFFSEVGGTAMTPAPLPDFSTAPVSPLRTLQDPMAPVDPDASRMLILETEVAPPT